MQNKIGIVYSPGYGAGWSTWGRREMALDQELAQAIAENQPLEMIEQIAERNWPEEYYGGLRDCVVKWVDKGTQFRIEECDGNESLIFNNNQNYWSVAE